MSKDKVIEYLQDSISTRTERNEKYKESHFGGAYIQFGHVMEALFPEGVSLKTADEINKYGCLSAIVSKTIRVANNFSEGHEDSLRDLPVYAAMLRELYDFIESGDEA